MEVPLISRGCLVLVLTAHLLSSPLVFAQDDNQKCIKIFTQPEFPELGEGVTLSPGEFTDDVVFCMWFHKANGSSINSLIFYHYLQNHKVSFRSGYNKRYFVGKDCMLHLTKLTMQDIGLYKIRKKRANVTETGEKLLELSRAKLIFPTVWSYRFLIWWCVWFNAS